jgi:hypothetical protein
MRQGRNGGLLKTGGNNGGGRPRKLPELDKLMANILGDEQNGVTIAEQILKAIEKKALKGDIKAAEMLLDRGYGKAKQTMDANVNMLEPLVIVTRAEDLPKEGND